VIETELVALRNPLSANLIFLILQKIPSTFASFLVGHPFVGFAQ